MKAEKGFTLLEVMIALAVFATLSAAVLSASSYVLGQSAGVEARLFAAWLADNHLSELQLQTSPVAQGRKTLAVSFAQRDWRVEQRIEPEPGSGLLRVELTVSPAGSEQAVQSVSQWILARNE